MDASEFDSVIGQASAPEERLAWFGALLTRHAGTYIEIVGGSAIEIYLSSDRYVSQDVDIVGDRGAVSETLRKWGFQEVTGRSQRIYWFKRNIGLVDLVGPVARSGLPARRIETPYGRAMLSAVEPLIVRRLARSKREGSKELFRQAIDLARLGPLDWEYLEAEAKYERVVPLLDRLRRSARSPKAGTSGRRRSRRGPRRND